MEQFSDISEEEMKEFTYVVKDIEKALKSTFNYDKINYLMLMMKDKHTHFHIIPRYAQEKEFTGLTWKDEGWPLNPGGVKEAVSQEVLNQVKQEIKKNL